MLFRDGGEKATCSSKSTPTGCLERDEKEGDFEKEANRVSGKRLVSGRNSGTGRVGSETRRISEVYLSLANSLASYQSSQDRTARNVEEVIQEERPGSAVPTEEREDRSKRITVESELTSSKMPTITLQRLASFAPSLESLKAFDRKARSKESFALKRALSMRQRATEPLLEEEYSSNNQASSSFLSYSSALYDESVSDIEKNTDIIDIKKTTTQKTFLQKAPSLFRRSITVNFSNKLHSDDRLKRIMGRSKMEEMHRMKQSFMEWSPEEKPGAGNITTLAERNDVVKRDIIKAVIEKEKKAGARVSPPKPPPRIEPKK